LLTRLPVTMKPRFLLTVLSLLSMQMAAQSSAPYHVRPDADPYLLLGAAWYPEQLPESRWDADLALMEKAHMRMVRVGEFAWTAMEPSEGNYQLDWLDHAITLAGKHGIKVVLGTPSASVPVWMEQKYPEVMLTDPAGKRISGTTRNHCDWNDARYKDFVREIDEKLAQRFGHNPNVIGWQLDNELPQQSFDADAQAQFHQWLLARYGTIDKLNDAWTTAYDNQTYSSFDEVPLVSGTADNNPGLWLDSKRFITDSLRIFLRVQIDAIHRYAEPSQRITTNMMPWYDYFDHYPIAADLDLIGIDNPQVEGTFDPVANGAIHDLMRGMKDKNYWVLETTAGPRGGGSYSVPLPKGAMRAAVWSDVGHGADLISYWQWRDALNGGEANHGALLDVDNQPDPIYSEWAQVGLEFAKADSLLKNTHPEATVAILHSYPSFWDVNWQKMNPKYDAVTALLSYYTPLHRLGYTVDIVPPDRDLSRYKLVIAPALELLTQQEADNLEAYVRKGGHLLLGQRSAMKDMNNSRWPQRQPGPLRSLLGGYVTAYDALDKPASASGTWGDASVQLFAEDLTPEQPDVTVLMRYHSPHNWIDGQPAAITRKVGGGRITYVGGWFDHVTMQKAMQWASDDAQARPDVFVTPEGVDVYRRTGNGHDVFVVVNSSPTTQQISLPATMQDVLHGGSVQKTIHLPPFDVDVLTIVH
jgi:beta-galactosidase